MKVCQLGAGTEQDSACQTVVQALRPYDLVGPDVLEVSIVEIEVARCVV